MGSIHGQRLDDMITRVAVGSSSNSISVHTSGHEVQYVQQCAHQGNDNILQVCVQPNCDVYEREKLRTVIHLDTSKHNRNGNVVDFHLNANAGRREDKFGLLPVSTSCGDVSRDHCSVVFVDGRCLPTDNTFGLSDVNENQVCIQRYQTCEQVLMNTYIYVRTTRLQSYIYTYTYIHVHTYIEV